MTPPPLLTALRNVRSSDKGLFQELRKASNDDNIKAAVLTGTGSYYSSGVDFAGALKPMAPSKFLVAAKEKNQEIFDAFLDFPKPIVAAVNGPAIGAPVTSATLCDAIVAAPEATFMTPFKRLGIVPEGCSSVWFEHLMGAAVAEDMLERGRKLDANEALEHGFIQQIVPGDKLLDAAVDLAQEFAAQGREKRVAAYGVDKLKQVNSDESAALAKAFLSKPFLEAQYNFNKDKGKTQAAALFWFLKTTNPLWIPK